MEMVKEAISDGMNTIQFLSKQVDMGVLLMQSAAKVSHRRFRFFVVSCMYVRFIFYFSPDYDLSVNRSFALAGP